MSNKRSLQETTSQKPASWLWHKWRGTVISRLILLFGFAAAWLIKWGGLSAPGVVPWETTRWVMGWAPSFLAAFTLTFLWPALGQRLLRGASRIDFLPECLAGTIIFSADEFLDGLVSKWGHTAPQTFDLLDLAAIQIGALNAFLFHS